MKEYLTYLEKYKPVLGEKVVNSLRTITENSFKDGYVDGNILLYKMLLSVMGALASLPDLNVPQSCRAKSNQIPKLKSPSQMFASVRKNGTLTINCELSEPEYKDHDEPYGLFHKKFSKFRFAIFNKEKSLYANMNVSSIPELISRTKFCKEEEYQRELKGNTAVTGESTKGTYLCMTSRFRAGGLLKGKSPYDVYKEFPDWDQKLQQQRNFLDANATQYPANKVLVNAIDDLYKLVNTEKIDQVSSGTFGAATVFSIYTGGLRPLQNRKNSKGYWFTYVLNIQWNFGEKNPVNVTIQNFFSPVKVNQDGTLNVQASTKEEFQTFSYSLTAEEWQWALYLMQKNMDAFTSIIANKVRTLATESARININH